MRCLLLTLRFNGGAYHGFQLQKNGESVAAAFGRAAEAVLGRRPDMKGCSRTDAGVHALAYGLSLRTESTMPADKLPLALNAHLPADIAVTACREVEEGFHARYSALGKQYRYVIHNARARDPFCEGLALHSPKRLDESAMDTEARAFLGTHDFSAFCAAGGHVENRVRTVTACSVLRRGDRVLVEVAGDGFLYHMVRIMVGTLLDTESGRLPRGGTADILASRSRARAGATAPAHGLYLARVDYPGFSLFG